jgi:hypothetical protein
VNSNSVVVTDTIQNDSLVVFNTYNQPFEVENTCCFYKPEIQSSGYAVCENEPITLEAYNGNNFAWSTGDTTNAITFPLIGLTEVWVECTNSCGTLRDTIKISPLPSPHFNVTVINPTLCAPDTLLLSITGDADSYYSSTGTLQSAGNDLYWYYPDSTQSIIISGINSYYYVGSCTTNDTLLFNANALSPQVTRDNNILISNYTSGNQWYLNGVVIQGATNDSLIANVDGNYKVKVTEDSCSAFSQDYAFQINSVITPTLTSKSIFPNPFTEEFTIRALTVNDKAKYTLTDLLGNKIPLNIIYQGQDNIVRPIGISSGIYLLEISSEGKKEVFKLVKR